MVSVFAIVRSGVITFPPEYLDGTREMEEGTPFWEMSSQKTLVTLGLADMVQGILILLPKLTE